MPQNTTDGYETARIDGAVVASLSNSADHVFWATVYTSVIRWMKRAGELAGTEEPDLETIVDQIGDDAGLSEWIEKAAGAARATGHADRDELRRWYHEDWLLLDPGLRSNIVTGLRKAALSEITVARRQGPQRGEPMRIGKRRGPWREWNTATLPAAARNAAETAMREIEQQRRIPNAAPAGIDGEGPGETGLRLLAAGMEHTVQAAEHIRQAGVHLKRAAETGANRQSLGATKRSLRSARENVVSLLETLMGTMVEVAAAEERARNGAGATVTGGVSDNAAQSPRATRAQTTGPPPADPDAPGPLAGQSIGIIGKLSQPHAVLIGRAMQAGASWSMTPTRRTSFIVVGHVRNPNAFGLRDARSLGIELIDEAEFNRRLAGPSDERATTPATDAAGP